MTDQPAVFAPHRFLDLLYLAEGDLEIITQLAPRR
jgi:hypothetical protein